MWEVLELVEIVLIATDYSRSYTFTYFFGSRKFFLWQQFPFSADENVASSDNELRVLGVDVEEGKTRSEDRELKDRLLRKFGSHISSLKLEFWQKKKKGKLQKEARQTLMEWWIVHYKWPYSTLSKHTHTSISNVTLLHYAYSRSKDLKLGA